MANFGERIRKRRIEVGMSQEELATRMEYKSKSTITKIEQGKRDVPQNKIAKFAEVLGTTPAVLMGWVDENTSKKNDDVVALVLRLRKDEKFLSVVKELNELDDEKLEIVEKMLLAFR